MEEEIMSKPQDQGQRTREGQSSGFLLKKPVLWSVSAVLYVTGVAFLLLLNGQYFTNGVCALISMVFSLAAWLRATETFKGRVFSMFMLLLYVVSITFIVAMLPSWFHEQKRFNQRGQLPIELKRPVAVVVLRDRAGHARAVDQAIGCVETISKAG
jgi:NADH:ubiquinone oxidoreductase subunit K